MIEVIIGWLVSFLLLLIIFVLVNKHKTGSGATSWLKILAISLSLNIAVLITLLLYEPVMSGFAISTDGFMNMNGPLTLVVIWIAVTLFMLVASGWLKEPLSFYYRPIRISLIVIIVLPIVLFLLLSVFAVSKAYALPLKQNDTALMKKEQRTDLYPYLGLNGLYGYADREGNLLIPTQYKRAGMFHNGAAVVTDPANGQYLIDQSNQRVVVPLDYDYLKLHSSIEGHTILEISNSYVNAWRFWEWQFLPGFQIIGGGSSDSRLFDTQVPRERRSMYWLESDKILKSRRAGPGSRELYMRVSWLGDNRVWIDDELFDLEGNKAKCLARRVKENKLTGDGNILQSKGTYFRIVDLYGEPVSRKRYKSLTVWFLDVVDKTTGEKEMMELKIRRYSPSPSTLGDFYQDRERQVFVFPNFSHPLPQLIQPYELTDTVTAEEILQKTGNITPIGNTGKFMLTSGSGRQRYVVDGEGQWHDPEESKDHISVVLPTGKVIWPEYDYFVDATAIPDGWRVREVLPLYSGGNTSIITLGREEERVKGLWSKAEGAWIIPPRYHDLSHWYITGNSIPFQEVKDGKWGYFDIQNRKVHIAPAYDRVSADNWVTLITDEGAQLSFYLDVERKIEYRELP